MGQGIVMTNVDFYEKEKILEYVISIDGVESIDQDGVRQMKEVIVEELANNSSFLSNVSVKMILKQGYRFRYIYTDVAGNKLAEDHNQSFRLAIVVFLISCEKYR